MKNLNIRCIAVGFMSIFATLSVFADNLKPNNITLDFRNTSVVYYKLSGMQVYFDCDVVVDDRIYPKVMCDGETVSEGTVELQDSKTVSIAFEPFLKTKMGNSYKIVIPAGTIKAEKDDNFINEEIVKEFYAPKSIHCSSNSIDTNCMYDYAQSVSFEFPTEVVKNDGADVLVYENDVLIEVCPISCSWDWDLGYAWAEFGNTVYFRKGFSYSILLPEGSLRHKDDPELVNQKYRVDFIGTYEDETSIQAKANGAIDVRVNGNMLVVSGIKKNDKILLITPDGIVVYKGVAKSACERIELVHNSVYILKVGTIVFKVNVY